jgi:hypothetical protein
MNLVYIIIFEAKIMASDKIEKNGYHGTTKENATKITKDGEFYISIKTHEWLGKGVYFWENVQDGFWWNNNEAVLCVNLVCKPEQYIDLDNDMHLLEEFVIAYVEEMTKHGKSHPNFKNKHEQRCFFCNAYKRTYDIMLMRNSFPIRGYNKAGFQKARAQLCATDNSIVTILGVKECIL